MILAIGDVDQAIERRECVVARRVTLALRVDRVGNAERLGTDLGDQIRGAAIAAQRRVGGAQRVLSAPQVDLQLPLTLKRPLQRDRPQRRGAVFARLEDPAARADLILQSEQIELVGLRLLHRARARQVVANAGRRYRQNGQDSWELGVGS